MFRNCFGCWVQHNFEPLILIKKKRIGTECILPHGEVSLGRVASNGAALYTLMESEFWIIVVWLLKKLPSLFENENSESFLSLFSLIKLLQIWTSPFKSAFGTNFDFGKWSNWKCPHLVYLPQIPRGEGGKAVCRTARLHRVCQKYKMVNCVVIYYFLVIYFFQWIEYLIKSPNHRYQVLLYCRPAWRTVELYHGYFVHCQINPNVSWH